MILTFIYKQISQQKNQDAFPQHSSVFPGAGAAVGCVRRSPSSPQGRRETSLVLHDQNLQLSTPSQGASVEEKHDPSIWGRQC